ncbi:MAG: nitrous oxide reductase accessory protein NosL [Gammaproteobacteria bacterium]|nr:nitrous oxide reductase accessory protein NosL [Gammaproteobacteria bacterium]
MNKLSILLFAFLLQACEKAPVAEAPPAHTLTRDASGYYCLMTVVNHSGPKGQVILTDREEPLWFTSARDTIAFSWSPEEPRNIAAIYVNDMTDADWDNPGADNWIEMEKAWYVINSKLEGGMGAPEAVPFATKEKAELFVQEQGGEVHDLTSLPKDYIMNPVY